MNNIFSFIGDHPILSIILAGIIGDCITDVAYILKGGTPECRGYKKNKEEK